MARILIADSDETLVQSLFRRFAAQGHEAASSASEAALLAQLETAAWNVAIVEHHPPQFDGLSLLARLREARGRTPVILTSRGGTTDTAIEAMKLGAYDYLPKPLELEEFDRIVADAAEAGQLVRDMLLSPGRVSPVTPVESGATRIVGTHRAMQTIFKLIGQVAERDVTVLITGESGTGKELAARAIHQHSRRSRGPFLAINCAAIPDALLESELFGHEAGAFTGADRAHAGKIERCRGGTLFFDEIGDMSLGTQAKVLRVLQEGEFERVGGEQPLRADVRLLAATNKDLEAEVRGGRFREDLYYRLKVISLHMPPLRARAQDIPALVDHFVARFASEYEKPVRFVADGALQRLRAYSWPGNVRQLENTLRRAILVCQGDVLRSEHLLLDNLAAAAETAPGREELRRRFAALAADVLGLSDRQAHANLVELAEEALIVEALRQCGHNQVHAAKLLGISRNTLRHRLKKYGISM